MYSSGSELQINKTNSSDTEAPCLDLHYTLFQMFFFSSTIYGKCIEFDVDVVNVQFIDIDIPRAPSYEVYTSQLIRFAAVPSHAADFNTRNEL